MKYLKLFLLFGVLFLLCGCTGTQKEPMKKSGFYFDTVIEITLYDKKDASLIDECFSFCDQFEKQVSRTIPTSEISKINTSKGSPVKVSDSTIELLKHGIYYSELSNGAFDITIAPLSILWDFKNNSGSLPSNQDILEALSHVSYKNIHIDGNMVTLTDPYAAIDLGAIAKGFMADYLKEFLVENGVTSALINLGGNILTIGNKPDGSPFQIGIQKPFDQQNIPITSVRATDLSVVTSGSYERYFEIGDTVYHHILDTSSGYPCNTGLLSVTILSESSMVGDALSTTCFALGLEKAKSLISSLENVEAIFVTDTYEIYDTSTDE